MAATGRSPARDAPCDAPFLDDMSGSIEGALTSKVSEAEVAVVSVTGVRGSGDTPTAASPGPEDAGACPGAGAGTRARDAKELGDTRSLTMDTALESLSSSNDTTDGDSEVFDTDAWDSSAGDGPRSGSDSEGVIGRRRSHKLFLPLPETPYEPLADLELECEVLEAKGGVDSHASSWTSVSCTDNESSIGWESSVPPTAASSAVSCGGGGGGGGGGGAAASDSSYTGSSTCSSSRGWRCSCSCGLCRRRLVGLRLMSKRSLRLLRVLRVRNRRHRRRRLRNLIANYSYNIWHWRSSSADSLSSAGLSRGHSPSAVLQAAGSCSRSSLLSPAGGTRSWDSLPNMAVVGGHGDA